MTDQLIAAVNRLERLLIEALGTRHQAIDDWAVIKFAIMSSKPKRAKKQAQTRVTPQHVMR